MNIFRKRSNLPFSCKSDRKKEKSVVSFTHEQNIICSQTKMEIIAHEQTIICRQLFAGHVVGSQPMKRKKNLQRMIIITILLCCSLPVPLSLADTLTIPLASISNVTSTCGTPRGAGGIPTCNEPCQKHRKGRVIFYYCTFMVNFPQSKRQHRSFYAHKGFIWSSGRVWYWIELLVHGGRHPSHREVVCLPFILFDSNYWFD